MKNLLLVILLFFHFTAKNQNKKEEVKMFNHWLNKAYIECLKNELPCECEKATGTFYSLVIDTMPESKNFGITLSSYGLIEPNVFQLKKINEKTYKILSNTKDTVPWGKVLIMRDSICLIESKSVSVFYKAITSIGFNTQHFISDNVQLIDESLSKRGYPKLEDIVKYDSLGCYCNKWKGKVNYLYSINQSKSWILEIASDSIFINTVTYSNSDPDPDDPIIPKRLKAYVWKKKVK